MGRGTSTDEDASDCVEECCKEGVYVRLRVHALVRGCAAGVHTRYTRGDEAHGTRTEGTNNMTCYSLWHAILGTVDVACYSLNHLMIS